VQLDEHWFYAGRKEKKAWLLYAYAVAEDEIIAFHDGQAKRCGRAATI
jgi:IS1 family transposase